ncbi:DUF4386 domain-containing protein [Acetobacterium sp.]|uniref:DUF4386 domain-containing protein n=1 Tax=Acetobacterium sp. TaxID=1872094 RepID=UPI002F40A171
MTSINKDARRAGLLYLAFVITCIFAGVVRSNLIVLGDASKTADLLENSMWLLRISFIVDLVSAVLFLLAAWALYVLLKPVHKDLALLFLLLNVAGVAVQCLSLLCLFAPMLINGSADFQKAFQPNQLDALNLLFLNLHKSGFVIAQIFYGTWLLPLGYLVYKSGFLPKWLGILLIADFFGVMIWFFQFFLLPGYDIITYPGLAISFIAEFSLSLWLLIKGVKTIP